MEIKNLFKGIYKGRKVLITGHTGFKGSWLALWLHSMGAEVIGYSLPPVEKENHFQLLHLPHIESCFANILEEEELNKVMSKHQPSIVFHLAAQALVRDSYQNPVLTYETNLLGSLKVYQAASRCHSVKAIVSITTDKVYENKEWLWGYRENDTLGGYDPYSASKACMEIMTDSYRKSFLKEGNILLATCRAGNVIGGGDWAKDRLIPDIIRGVIKQEKTIIRNPSSIRPWQHVLEPLAGYLLLGKELLEGNMDFAQAWNFGPDLQDCRSVGEVLSLSKKHWEEIDYEIQVQPNAPHEAGMLKLDCTKSLEMLHWKPVWTLEECIEKTIQWYRAFLEKKELLSQHHINQYIHSALLKNNSWIN